MLKKLFSKFKIVKDFEPEVTETQDEKRDLEIRWLDAKDSPFGIPGVDCFKFTQTMISSSGDENVARKFQALRSSIGCEYVNSLPDDPIEVIGNLEYEFPGNVENGAQFKAQQMEEKWDIYLYENKIYFCRSWTGQLIYIADFEVLDAVFKIIKIMAAKSHLSYGGLYARQQVDYLVKNHLFNIVVPHPLPGSMKEDLQAIAFFSLSNYGRRCCFATYENTIEYKRSEHGLSA